MILNFIGNILSFVGNRIPTCNLIVFCSFPDYSDNAWAFFRYLCENKIEKKYKLVWLSVDKTKLNHLKAKLKEDGYQAEVYYRFTVKGIWSFLRCRYVITTHGLFDFIKLHQHKDKNICLWHGMPLKLLGASHNDGVPCSSNFDYTIATSVTYQKIMAEAFACSVDKVLITGQPRNDLLFEQTDWFEKNNIDKSKYKRVGIWMPTYRKSIIGEIRLDGDYCDRCISFLDEQKLILFDSFLGLINTLILIKIHPMDALQNYDFDDFNNLIFIKPKDLNSQLYPLLGNCDFLLTDYSSVYVDFQILRKPIGFVMNDIESYKGSRGLYFDDLDKSLPGPLISNYEELCNFVETPVVKDCDIQYNMFFDNKSSERIANHLNILS